MTALITGEHVAHRVRVNHRPVAPPAADKAMVTDFKFDHINRKAQS